MHLICDAGAEGVPPSVPRPQGWGDQVRAASVPEPSVTQDGRRQLWVRSLDSLGVTESKPFSHSGVAAPSVEGTLE